MDNVKQITLIHGNEKTIRWVDVVPAQGDIILYDGVFYLIDSRELNLDINGDTGVSIMLRWLGVAKEHLN
jgi:hypothetical protein